MTSQASRGDGRSHYAVLQRGPECPSWVMSGTATSATDAAALSFRAVLLFGIASARSGDIEIWSTSRDEANATLWGA